MSIRIIICIALTFFSCKEISNRSTTLDIAKNQNSSTLENKAALPSSLDTTIQVAVEQTPYIGELYHQVGWEDLAGQHLFLIAQKYSKARAGKEAKRDFFAYQYLKQGQKWQLEWKVEDSLEWLGCDLLLRIPKKYIKIADVDDDAYLETLFIYGLDNRCDASMYTSKLILFSKGKRLTIEGFSAQYLGPPEAVFNQYRAEEGLPPISYKKMDAAPSLSQTHKVAASALWDRMILEEKENLDE